jgi:hypothetical protein
MTRGRNFSGHLLGDGEATSGPVRGIIALVLASSIAFLAIYWHLFRGLPASSLSLLLAFAVIAGLAIANFDVVQSFKIGPAEVTTYKREIEDARAEALQAIESEVASLESDLQKA